MSFSSRGRIVESRKATIAVEDRFKVVPFEEFYEIAHVGHSRGYEIVRFSDELIRVFGKLSKEVLADTAAKDPLTRKAYDSYMAGRRDGLGRAVGNRLPRRLALG